MKYKIKYLINHEILICKYSATVCNIDKFILDDNHEMKIDLDLGNESFIYFYNYCVVMRNGLEYAAFSENDLKSFAKKWPKDYNIILNQIKLIKDIIIQEIIE